MSGNHVLVWDSTDNIFKVYISLMKYRHVPTLLSMLMYAAVTAHGDARVCGDYRFPRSVLVLAATMNITLVALFFFRFCFENTDNNLFVYFPVHIFSAALSKIRIQLHRGAGPKWQDEEHAQVIRTLKQYKHTRIIFLLNFLA